MKITEVGKGYLIVPEADDERKATDIIIALLRASYIMEYWDTLNDIKKRIREENYSKPSDLSLAPQISPHLT